VNVCAQCGALFEPDLDPWPDIDYALVGDMRLAFCPGCLPGRIAARDQYYAQCREDNWQICQDQGHWPGEAVWASEGQRIVCLRCGLNRRTGQRWINDSGWVDEERSRLVGDRYQ
jgi:hypothetical protein